MRRTVIAGMLTLLSMECHAQGTNVSPDQCNQVRSAIAQYGLQAARAHAVANYGLSPTDVRSIEQSCGITGGGNRGQRQPRGNQPWG